MKKDRLPDTLAERYGISEREYQQRICKVARQVVDAVNQTGVPFDEADTLTPSIDFMQAEGLYPVEIASLRDINDATREIL